MQINAELDSAGGTMTRAQTPRSTQRGRVLETYRGRGHRNSNLWLAYSVKLNQDLLFHSDTSFVHWLAYLESDTSVVDFSPIPDEMSSAVGVSPASAMLVRYPAARWEIHIVAARDPGLAHIETQFGQAAVRVVGIDELRTQSMVAIRWLKAVSYAGMFRYQDLTPVMNQLATVFKRTQSGTMDELCEHLTGHDRASVFGATAKAAIHGYIALDLTSHGLCGASRWKVAPWRGW